MKVNLKFYILWHFITLTCPVKESNNTCERYHTIPLFYKLYTYVKNVLLVFSKGMWIEMMHLKTGFLQSKTLLYSTLFFCGMPEAWIFKWHKKGARPSSSWSYVCRSNRYSDWKMTFHKVWSLDTKKKPLFFFRQNLLFPM